MLEERKQFLDENPSYQTELLQQGVKMETQMD